jgi:hypothetical protein
MDVQFVARRKTLPTAARSASCAVDRTGRLYPTGDDAAAYATDAGSPTVYNHSADTTA